MDMSAIEEPHRGFTRHFASSKDWSKEQLTTLLKEKLRPNIVNGLKAPESLLGDLQEIYIDNFSRYKIRMTQKLVTDITSKERQCEIIETEHKRAHRNARENGEQILEQFYFPHMRASIRKYVAGCDVCNKCKYDRKPSQIQRQQTPDPKYPCEILHMDIMEIQGQKFITCIDKFTKFAKFFSIKDRSLLTVRKKLIKVLHYFTVPKILVTDNERSFLSPLIEAFIKSLGIKLYLTPTQRSEVNGQVERLHSTIIEVYRCLRTEYPDLSVKELIEICVDRYNNTIHSTTKRRPRDLFFNRINGASFEKLLSEQKKVNTDLRHLLKRNMAARNAKMNRNRQSPKKYRKGDRIYVAIKTIQGKNKALYRKEIVEKDNRVTVLTKSGRKIHKEHIKNLKGLSPKKNTV
ncbi:Retrovirus-related Pol polyprotein from transposon opus [Eumeta japonica]|uniref:RNA-directed DNA polymerase n=1 Tax=Eumeta variegata TaxID=151549 RepID=A0A4C1SG06_EUMVA|nr:Retrovirus-related Pol polyprotein from transposon opus [Eumeta japonica]